MNFLRNINGAFEEVRSLKSGKLAWLGLKFRIFYSRMTAPLFNRSEADYLRMQKRQYEAAAAVATVESGRLSGDCVAALDWNFHNSFPDYQKYIFAKAPQGGLALEYGCGPGRNILHRWASFQRMDGVDISVRNIENANRLVLGVIPADRFPRFFVTKGEGADEVQAGSYDFCFSVICLQHIASWSIRYKILKSLHRALKPGGVLAFQLGYDSRASETTVGYREDRFNTGVTNGGCDCRVDDPEEVIKDLREIGFGKVEYNVGPVPAEISSVHRSFIYFAATK